MILKGLTVADHTTSVIIRVSDGYIAPDTAADTNEQTITFDDAIAFPGLINSHDHLDFNNFPPLGNRFYQDYVEWGNDIHAVYQDEIRRVLSIPKPLRVQWSLYKNLLNGVTTVVQHGEYFEVNDELIGVFQDCIAIHSVQLERRWKLRLNKPRWNDRPVVIHIGEGINHAAAAEIDKLIRWNILKKKLIGVHGIAMNKKQAGAFIALVWCPSSNYFLFDTTADLPSLKQVVPLLFGTDSTLTAPWDMWVQIKQGLDTGFLNTPELYAMLTARPAEIWKMRNKGSLQPGSAADLVVARKKQPDFIGSFAAVTPEDLLLVLHRGVVRLFDASLLPQMKAVPDLARFSMIDINGASKYVYGDLPGLLKDIRSHYPEFDLPGINIP